MRRGAKLFCSERCQNNDAHKRMYDRHASPERRAKNAAYVRSRAAIRRQNEPDEICRCSREGCVILFLQPKRHKGGRRHHFCSKDCRRKAMNERVKKWKLAHPERCHEIARKAFFKHRDRNNKRARIMYHSDVDKQRNKGKERRIRFAVQERIRHQKYKSEVRKFKGWVQLRNAGKILQDKLNEQHTESVETGSICSVD